MQERRDQNRRPDNPPSLRGRYLWVASLTVLLIFASTAFMQNFVTNTKNLRSRNIEERNELAIHTRHLRDAIMAIDRHLAAFLWEPSEERRAAVHQAIDQARERQQTLYAIPWMRRSGTAETLHRLPEALQALHTTLEQVMEARVDTERQFPPLSIIQERSNPAHNDFLSANRVAIADAGRLHPDDTALRWLLASLRNDWLLMIGQFRIYVANRVGHLHLDDLGTQRRDVDTVQTQIASRLEQLARLDRAGRMDMELSDALVQMQAAAERWKKAFRDITALDVAHDWRIDAPYLRDTVEPAFSELWGTINRLDMAMEAFATEDIRAISQAGQTLINAFWTLAFLSLVLVIIGFLLFERTVLNPVTTMARAMRAEAHGDDLFPLPHPGNRETVHLVDAFSEMRRQIQERQQALEHQALHDALTGLPNRVLLQDRVEQAIRQQAQHDGCLGLLVMDLDGFKEVNDTLGHQMGDRLLQKLARRLSLHLNDTGTLARLGGDEFGILLPEADGERARTVAERLLAELERPFSVENHNLYVGCSIGIALYPQHARSALGLNRRADVAMYVAKREKRGVVLYDARQDSHSIQRLALAGELRQAIAGEQLELHYQPQLRLRDGAVQGVEALLRWPHPQQGPISPEVFIPLAEQTGLIRPLTLWVLDQALAQCASWKQQGITFGTMGINLSVFNLQDSNLHQEVARLLKKWGIDPDCLLLEITESAMMANPIRALTILRGLHELGVKLAIDDFGTGFSSLAYLKQLPVDKLKIDKSFVIDMYADENDAVIVRSTIDLAHNLGLQVVAEGVESREVLELLAILRCDEIQGFHLSRPLSAAAAGEWLRAPPRAAAEVQRLCYHHPHHGVRPS